MNKYISSSKNEADRMAKALNSFLTEKDWVIRDNFSHMSSIDGAFVVTCVLDLFTKEYLFVSENVEQIFGLKAEDVRKKGMLAALNYFIETHRPILIDQILPLVFTWYESFCKQGRDAKQTKLSYSLNMYDKSGRQMSTIHSFAPLAVNESGFPTVMSKHIFRSPLLNEAQPPRMVMEYIHGSGEIEIVFEKTFQVPGKSGEVLSTREKEILELMKEGHTSKEIAGKLDISVNTFYNHRKNILKKYDSKQLLQVLTHS